jgi:hypothetical protein
MKRVSGPAHVKASRTPAAEGRRRWHGRRLPGKIESLADRLYLTRQIGETIAINNHGETAAAELWGKIAKLDEAPPVDSRVLGRDPIERAQAGQAPGQAPEQAKRDGRRKEARHRRSRGSFHCAVIHTAPSYTLRHHTRLPPAASGASFPDRDTEPNGWQERHPTDRPPAYTRSDVGQPVRF